LLKDSNDRVGLNDGSLWTHAVTTGAGTAGARAARGGPQPAEPGPAALWAGWQDSRELMAITLDGPQPAESTTSGHRRVRSFSELSACRPDVVVVNGFGFQALLALLYSHWHRRTRVVLWLTSRAFPGAPDRLILNMVDAVVANTAVVAHEVELRGVPASRVFTLADAHDLSAFLDLPPSRDPAEAHRMIHVGALTPAAGVADFQSVVAAWAEEHRDRPVEIWWAGEGSLRGVLQAQPLPDHMTQRFLGPLDTNARAAAFAQCGLLVLPSLHSDWGQVVQEALAAGLPVLGSRRNHDVVQLVQNGVTGWRFDPFSPDSMHASLDLALQASCAELDRMRAAAREAGLRDNREAGAPGIAGQMARIVTAVAQRPQPQAELMAELQT
jgi:glycosyltransferase involved in cell wall biosynthesis